MKTLRVIFFLVLAAAGAGALAQPKEGDSPHVDLIVIDGSINPAVDDFIGEAIARAKAGVAQALIIQLDTPGGHLSSTQTIVKKMLGATVPVIVYVAPAGAGAGSAGVFITLAGHIAAMAPGTNIGAAHPVSGLGKMDEIMTKKITSDAAAYIRSKAERRGRNVAMAEKAVIESRSFTEKEALELKLIDLIAKDVPDLLAQLE